MYLGCVFTCQMKLFLVEFYFIFSKNFFSIQGTTEEKESPKKYFPSCPLSNGWEEKEDHRYLIIIQFYSTKEDKFNNQQSNLPDNL